jgi:hypothetical protein
MKVLEGTRYPASKPYDYRQTVMLPVDFEQQILPGTFEHSLHCLVDSELDLSPNLPNLQPVDKVTIGDTLIP